MCYLKFSSLVLFSMLVQRSFCRAESRSFFQIEIGTREISGISMVKIFFLLIRVISYLDEHSIVIQQNVLSNLPQNLLKNDKNIKIFLLPTNRISSIPENIFSNNHHIKYISFFENLIQINPVNLLKNL